MPEESQKHSKNWEFSDCLEKLFKPETVPGYYCRYCKESVETTRQLRIWKKPQILVFHFKKFCQDNFGEMKKNKQVIAFPEDGLCLDEYTHVNSKGK